MDYHRLHRAPRDTSSGKQTILVVDDHEDLRDAIAVLLESEGYEVLDAPNGREALQYLLSGKSHVAAIVLDLAMPVMDGWQFLEARRTHAALSEIPTIVVTGVSDARRRQRELDDLAVFTKPFQFDELIGELRRQLGEGKRAKPTVLEF